MQLTYQILRTVVDLKPDDSVSLRPEPDMVSPGDHPFSILLSSGSVIDCPRTPIVEKLLIRGLTRKQLSDLAQDIFRSLS